MRADFRALLEHDDGKLGVDLLQPDRRRKPGRPRADDHHVEFHRLAFGKFLLLAHYLLRLPAPPRRRSCLTTSFAKAAALVDRENDGPRPILHPEADILTFT